MEPKDQSGIIKYVIYGVLVLLCAVLFIVFGLNRGESGGRTIEPSSEPTASTTKAPVGVSYVKLVSRLSGALPDCTLSEPKKLDDGRFFCSVDRSEERRRAELYISADEYGRVSAVELRIFYKFSGEPGADIIEVVRQAILEEYAAREAADLKLISGSVDTVLDMFSADFNISAIDRTKLAPAILNAYSSKKKYELKPGLSRFYCSTTANGIEHTFTLIAQFNLPEWGK